MNEGLRQQEVRDLTEACRDYWRRNGVPDDRAFEMSLELGDHLREALAAGKTAEDVIGSDVERFAEEWAAPNRPRRSLVEETLDVFSDATVALAVLAALTHAALWSPTLPVNANGVLGGLLFALLFTRLFAQLRAPSDAPPSSDKSVVDQYPRRLLDTFVILLVAVWAAYLYLPLSRAVLINWSLEATLLLPLLAVLIRAAKRLLPERMKRPATQVRPGVSAPVSPTEHRRDVGLRSLKRWAEMRIPGDQAGDLLDDLNDHIDEAVAGGRSVRSVVGDDVEAFAEAWAEEHVAEPGHKPGPEPEPIGDVISGWILSFSACATGLAVLFHLLEWSLYVPVVWIFGLYLLLVACWFGQPVADLLDRVKAWRYSPAKSMLAAGLLALLLAAVSVAMTFLFVVVGPRIPFEWPWYATAISAVVAGSIVALWLRRFSREEAEREERGTGQESDRFEDL